MYTLRQYRPHQKTELYASYPMECRAVAACLKPDVLLFQFASVFQNRDGTKTVRVEFGGDGRVVWIEAAGDSARRILDQPEFKPMTC